MDEEMGIIDGEIQEWEKKARGTWECWDEERQDLKLCHSLQLSHRETSVTLVSSGHIASPLTWVQLVSYSCAMCPQGLGCTSVSSQGH